MPETKSKTTLESLVVRPLLAGLVAAGAVAPIAAPAADDIFLKIEGIQGDSTDSKHAKEIVLLSYSQSFTNPVTSSGATGKAKCGDVTVSKLIDRSSPNLIAGVVGGQHFAKAVISFRSVAGKSTSDYYTVTLTDVVLDAISQSDSAGGGVIMETVSMTAAKFNFDLRIQNADGSFSPGPRFGWDCSRNTKL